MDKVKTEIWAKLFENEGRQLLVEKAYAWNDEKDKDEPALVFRVKITGGEMEHTIFFDAEHIRDEAFNVIDGDFEKIIPNWLEFMTKFAAQFAKDLTD